VYKTAVYTFVNCSIQGLTEQKLQNHKKVILRASHNHIDCESEENERCRQSLVAHGIDWEAVGKVECFEMAFERADWRWDMDIFME